MSDYKGKERRDDLRMISETLHAMQNKPVVTSKGWHLDVKFAYLVIMMIISTAFSIGIFVKNAEAESLAVNLIAKTNTAKLNNIATKNFVVDKLLLKDREIEAVNTAVTTLSKQVDRAEKRNSKRFDRMDSSFDRIEALIRSQK